MSNAQTPASQTDVQTPQKTRTKIRSPHASASEHDTHVELRLEIPGVSVEHVDVKFANGNLTIVATREEPEPEGMRHREFGSVRFRKSFTVPQGFDASRIEASLDRGVLTLTIPRSEELRPRQIKITG